MTQVSIGLGHDQVPVVEPSTWPLTIRLDEHSTLTVFGGDTPELAGWLRTFAANLLSHAEVVDAAHARSVADLAAARRDVELARAGRL